jgi:tRNA pseudouridine55 synthase
LAEQIGAELGCPAHLAGLRRTRIGLLSVDEAQTLATLEAQPIEIRRSHIQPPQILLQSVPSLILDEPAVRAVRQGQLLRRAVERSGLVQLQGPGGELVGLAQAGADGTIAPKRILLPTAAASDTA